MDEICALKERILDTSRMSESGVKFEENCKYLFYFLVIKIRMTLQIICIWVMKVFGFFFLSAMWKAVFRGCWSNRLSLAASQVFRAWVQEQHSSPTKVLAKKSIVQVKVKLSQEVFPDAAAAFLFMPLSVLKWGSGIWNCMQGCKAKRGETLQWLPLTR